ncbi:hypothetical protein GWK47_032591 [Chionoecetes opilio]|uniref:Uncharacterized protein n=1 Tax=Chionoecetes opilio TaxID=41210 RepID=A0A8J4YU97_CHIOP|nr:hypothetical protein GWK47_032591 [Chionoecetes opilio]
MPAWWTMPNPCVFVNIAAHTASSRTVLKVETRHTPTPRQAQAVVLSDDGEKIVRQKPSLPPKPSVPKKPAQGGPGVPVGPPQRVHATMRTLPRDGSLTPDPPQTPSPATNTFPRSPSARPGGDEPRTNSLTRGIQKMLRAASRSSNPLD